MMGLTDGAGSYPKRNSDPGSRWTQILRTVGHSILLSGDPKHIAVRSVFQKVTFELLSKFVGL